MNSTNKGKKNLNECVESYVFKFGKYRGKTLNEVYEMDSSYISWVSKLCSLYDYDRAVIKRFLMNKNM